MAHNNIPELKFEKYTLDNGLDVILSEDHRLPLVAVNLWYHVGPVNERPGLTGFAHLFEHMMFEGSRNVEAEGHFRLLEAAGASDINGTTDFDRTNYFETLPSDQLELALWLESDRMGYLLEKLDGRKLENQRDVVRNERRQAVEAAPYGLVQEAIFHQLFPENHPYYASVIGSHRDIEAARLKDVREFFRLYYAPNNASLAIVGDIDPARTRELVEKYFGPIPAGPPVPPVSIFTPPITLQRRIVIGDQVELPRIYLAWITDPIFGESDARCDLIARILGGGKSSRLYKRLVYEKRIAQDAAAHQYSLALGSIFTIEATAKPGVTPEDLERAVDEELELFFREGPSREELSGARNTIETSIIRGLETLGGFGGVADRLNLYNHFLGDPGYLPRDIQRYRDATTASLKETGRRLLSPQSRVVVFGVPGDKVIDDPPRSGQAEKDEETLSAPEVSGQEWRSRRPSPGPSAEMQLPVPNRFRLENGLTVYLLEKHNLPLVSANIIVLSGSERNPANRPGLASFAAEMLDEGTVHRSAIRIAEDAEQLGAGISTGSTADYSFAAFRALKKNADAAFELAADVLLNPRFDGHEIERIRHDRLTEILRQRDNPNALANKAFFLEIYGESHPYGYVELGTEASQNSITRDELVQFWRLGYTPGNSALVVAGDITPAELLALAEKHLSGWSGSANRFALPALGGATGCRIVIVDKPGLPQTSLRIGHLGVERAHPDCIPLDVMNTALGGLFTSRINMNLREEHGYTYGASSAFAFRRGPGPFVVATSVRTDVTAAAATEIVKELDRMRIAEPTAEELSIARDSISRSLPGMFETSVQSASTAGQLFVHGLPLDYYRTLPGEVDAVTAADVRRVAERHLQPERLLIVAVGDRSFIEPQLEDLRITLADGGTLQFTLSVMHS